MRKLISGKLIAGLPGSPRLWITLSLAALLGYGFVEVADFVFDDSPDEVADAHQFDKAVAQFVQGFRNPLLTQVAIDLTALGSASVLSVFALLAMAGVLGAKDRLGALHLGIALLGAFLWPEMLKGLFERERPEGVLHLVTVRTLSFPSGHSFGAAASYATYAFFFARYVPRWRTELFCYVLAAAIVATVGLTRIYLGVHYATDVMAGICAGGAWAFFVAAVFSHFYGQSRARATTRRATA